MKRQGRRLVVAALWCAAGAACDGDTGSVRTPPGGDGDDPATHCPFDSSYDLDTAWAAPFDTTLSDSFCPRRDVDYWRITVPSPGQLVRVELRFPYLSDLELALEWQGPAGACEDAAERECFAQGDCLAGGCTVSRSRLLPSPVAESGDNPSQHLLVANLPAARAGDYVLSVFDLGEREQSERAYTLQLSLLPEPDAHEPNDHEHLATEVVVTPSVERTLAGYLPHVQDVDWYRVQAQPPLGSQALVGVELSWPQLPGAEALELDWELVQGSFHYPAPAAASRGTGETSERYRRARLVAPEAGELLIKVSKVRGSLHDTNGYALKVVVEEDLDEQNTRNDEAAAATVIPVSGFGTVYNQSGHTLVAPEDVDWYRIDRSGLGVNSVLHVVAEAPADAGYLLRMSLYESTGQACSNDADCRTAGSVGVCLTGDNVCLQWNGVQRPPPLGIEGAGSLGDPQTGGLSPNYLEARLPLFDDAPQSGILFIRMGHIRETPLDLPGFSTTAPYHLTVTHEAEPESFEQSAASSEFAGDPTAMTGGELAAIRRPQSLSATIVDPGASAHGFVTVEGNPVLVAGVCSTLSLQARNARGEAMTSDVTVSVTQSAGELFVDCTAEPRQPAASVLLAGGSGSIAYEAAVGTASQQVGLGLSAAGLDAVTWRLSLVDTALPVLQVQSSSAGFALIDTVSNPIRVALPAAVGTNVSVVLAVDPPGAELLRWSNADDDWCVCGAGCTCGAIAAGQTGLDLAIRSSAAGPVTLTASAGGYGTATLAVGVSLPRELIQEPAGVLSGTGFISYDGDQDWFSIDTAGFPAASVRLSVDFPASPVDLRVSVWRGSDGTGVGRGDDVCLDGCGSGGSCDEPGHTCTYGNFAITADPAYLDPAEHCTYLPSTADRVYVWLNDYAFNDGDVVSPYSLRVELVEGCSSACDPDWCAR